jgi:hypothetical protein
METDPKFRDGLLTTKKLRKLICFSPAGDFDPSSSPRLFTRKKFFCKAKVLSCDIMY